MASGGCGPTALAIVLRNLLGLEITPEETAAFALECGARASSGTNMRRLAAQAALFWPLAAETVNDTATLLSALQGGSVAVCNVSGDRAGRKGIFSTGGHYVVAIAGDADCVQVLDPGIYAGKYLAAYRAEAVTQLGDVLLCAPETLEADCQNRNPMYYIFRAK